MRRRCMLRGYSVPNTADRGLEGGDYEVTSTDPNTRFRGAALSPP